MYPAPSVSLSVRNKKFSYFPSLLFSDFLHQVSLQKVQKSDEVGFLRKKCFGPKLGKKGPKWAQNGVFGNFLNFASLEIAYFVYSSSFQQCLATSATKLAEKKCFGPKLGPFRPKIGISAIRNRLFCISKFISIVFSYQCNKIV